MGIFGPPMGGKDSSRLEGSLAGRNYVNDVGDLRGFLSAALREGVLAEAFWGRGAWGGRRN